MSDDIPHHELLRHALMAVAVIVGPRRPFFVAIGLGPDEGMLTGGSTSVEDQCTMLHSVLASFEAKRATVAVDERVDVETEE